MTGFAVLVLFGSTFAIATWTLILSIRPQLHRFAELFGTVPAVAALPPRRSRVTVRAAPARMPARLPQQRRAAA
jgi:hypothetical protein